MTDVWVNGTMVLGGEELMHSAEVCIPTLVKVRGVERGLDTVMREVMFEST